MLSEMSQSPKDRCCVVCLCEASTAVGFVDAETGLAGQGDLESSCGTGVGFCVVGDDHSGVDGGKGCPAVRTCLAPSNRTLKWLKWPGSRRVSFNTEGGGERENKEGILNCFQRRKRFNPKKGESQ